MSVVAKIADERVHIIDPQSKNSMSVYFERITPEIAQRLLQRNTENNRKIKQRNVQRYADAMINGTWVSASEPLKFDENGDLCDGQHRLSAICKSGKSVWMMCITGFPKKSMSILDDGAARSFADAMKVNNLKVKSSISAVASATKHIATMRDMAQKDIAYDTARSRGIANSELIRLYKSIKGYEKRVNSFYSTYAYTKMGRNMACSIAIAIYWVAECLDQDIIYSMFKTLETSIPFDSMGEHSPMYHMVLRIREMKEAGKPIRFGEYLNMFLYCYELLAKNKPLQRMNHKLPDMLSQDGDNMRLVKQKLQRLA